MAKYRTSFVTNSSSSSFVISKFELTPRQVERIKNHKDDMKDYDQWCGESDAWTIKETETTISGYTDMDNFPMWDFLEDIGVADNLIIWREY